MKERSKYVFLIAALLSISIAPAQGALKFVKIYDGDTVTMADGVKIRLLQIDAPELAENECFAKESKTALVNLLAKKGTITLKADPASASFDRYGRAPITAVAGILGHASTQMTLNVYGHLYEDDANKYMDRLGDSLFNSGTDKERTNVFPVTLKESV